jgi:hypothetical protein
LEGNMPFSSKQQYWAGGQGDGPETNGPAAILAGESLNGFPIGDGTVSLTLTELESKINVNTADGPFLKEILTTQNADAGSISVVSDSILDWIDPDDNTRPAGAESDYYLGLTPSYNAKNAPMDSTEELQLVKGVTHDMYYGTPPEQAPEHELGFGHAPNKDANYNFGLADVFTAASSGKVNLLTADDSVLQCIPGLGDGSFHSAAVADLEAAREESDPPVRNIQQLLAAAHVPQQAVGQIMNYVDHWPVDPYLYRHRLPQRPQRPRRQLLPLAMTAGSIVAAHRLVPGTTRRLFELNSNLCPLSFRHARTADSAGIFWCRCRRPRRGRSGRPHRQSAAAPRGSTRPHRPFPQSL